MGAQGQQLRFLLLTFFKKVYNFNFKNKHMKYSEGLKVACTSISQSILFLKYELLLIAGGLLLLFLFNFCLYLYCGPSVSIRLFSSWSKLWNCNFSISS